MFSGEPDFGTELVVRLFDRIFASVFLAERSPEEQETIVRTFTDMIVTYAEQFATPAGLEGVSARIRPCPGCLLRLGGRSLKGASWAGKRT